MTIDYSRPAAICQHPACKTTGTIVITTGHCDIALEATILYNALLHLSDNSADTFYCRHIAFDFKVFHLRVRPCNVSEKTPVISTTRGNCRVYGEIVHGFAVTVKYAAERF